MFAIAPTDLEWFERLRTGPIPALVNFWTPTPWNVRRLTANDRFYFLLKHPTHVPLSKLLITTVTRFFTDQMASPSTETTFIEHFMRFSGWYAWDLTDPPRNSLRLKDFSSISCHLA